MTSDPNPNPNLIVVLMLTGLVEEVKQDADAVPAYVGTADPG